MTSLSATAGAGFARKAQVGREADDDGAVSTAPRGSRTAASKPTAAKAAMAARASANSRFPVVSVETSTEPAMAVPSDDPRLETLRDNPKSPPGPFRGRRTGPRSQKPSA